MKPRPGFVGWRVVAASLLAAVALTGEAYVQATASVISGLNISGLDAGQVPGAPYQGSYNGFLQMAQYVDSSGLPVTVNSFINGDNYPAALNGGKIILNVPGVVDDTTSGNGQANAEAVAYGVYNGVDGSGNPIYVPSAITNWIQAGRQGGAWTGTTGITDQAAAVDVANYGGELTSVGVVVNSDIAAMTGSNGYATFGGVPVGANSILMAHTYIGDTTLKGYVDLDDIQNVVTGYNAGNFNPYTGGAPGWEMGDFAGTGYVTLDDIQAVVTGYNFSNTPISPESLSYGSSTGGPASPNFSPTPEPGTLALLAAGGLAALLAVWRKKRARD